MADIGSELRWILLVFSVVLIAGLYIAGRWGRRQSVDGEASRDVKRDAGRDIGRDAGRDAGREYVRAKAQTVPQLDEVVSARERPIEPRVTIVAADEFDDLPDVRIDSPSDSLDPVQSSDSIESQGPVQSLDISQRWNSFEDDEPLQLDDNDISTDLERSQTHINDSSDAPIQTNHVTARPVASAAKASGDVAKPTRAPVKNVGSRKIIALRLVSGAQRFDGAQLKDAFEAAQLRHGKYGIYHRYDEQELTLFSVASMVEPGTFDPDTMSAVQFQGVMLFAQLPGPMDGELMLDEMLACAEQLSNRLGGTIQDERGAVLTPQRAERMRDEIADFQHLLGVDSLSSSRGAGEGAAAS